MARKDYDQAISQFEDSYKFFSEHDWLDRYRSITLMSPSVWCYREMALMNIASACVAKEEYAEAEKVCRRVLEEYPDNEVASNALRTIQALTNSTEG